MGGRSGNVCEHPSLPSVEVGDAILGSVVVLILRLLQSSFPRFQLYAGVFQIHVKAINGIGILIEMEDLYILW